MNLRRRVRSGSVRRVSGLSPVGQLAQDYYRDPTMDQIGMLRQMSSDLPASRVGGGALPTEGLFDFLSAIPIVGPLVSGLLGGGGGTPAPAPAGGATTAQQGSTASAGLPGLPGLPGLQNLLPALMQGLGLGGAANPFQALMGAGLGGLPGIFGGGTGPLPGALGGTAQGMYGVPAVPPYGIAGQMFPDQAAYNQLAQHTSAAGRAIINRIMGLTNPQLAQIQALLERRASQIQATAEHRTIQSAEQWRNRILELLTRPGGTTIDRQLEQVMGTYNLGTQPRGY